MKSEPPNNLWSKITYQYSVLVTFFSITQKIEMNYLVLSMPLQTLMIHFFCSGKVIVHALDENARAYYNLEGLWTCGTLQNEPVEVNMCLNF
jgi:hypothetical protein